MQVGKENIQHVFLAVIRILIISNAYTFCKHLLLYPSAYSILAGKQAFGELLQSYEKFINFKENSETSLRRKKKT